MQNLYILGKNFEITWNLFRYNAQKGRLDVHINKEWAGTLAITYFDEERLNRTAYQLALAYFGLQNAPTA